MVACDIVIDTMSLKESDHYISAGNFICRVAYTMTSHKGEAISYFCSISCLLRSIGKVMTIFEREISEKMIGKLRGYPKGDHHLTAQMAEW